MPNQEIDLGLLCEMGSWSHDNGTRYPYNLIPQLLDPAKGAPWYFREHIDPHLARGLNRVLFHRPFGEIVQGDGAQDYDSYHLLMVEGDDPVARAYVASFLSELAAMGQRHPGVGVTVYVGGVWSARMKALRRSSIKLWCERVWSQIAPFERLGLPVPIRYAFDASSVWVDERGNPRMEDPEWVALSMLRAVLGRDRVLIEALPRDDQPDQWGLPSIAWETVYQYQSGVRSHIGPVVRVLDSTSHGGVWSDRAAMSRVLDISPLALFVFDCLNRGHQPFSQPRILDGYPDLERVRSQVRVLFDLSRRYAVSDSGGGGSA